MLTLVEARYRCTSCGDCCRGWDVPLEPGEAQKFLALAAPLIPAERLRGAVGRGKHNGVAIERLVGRDGQCAALADDQLCRIHGAHGGEAKPRACRIFPFTFVRTPSSVRVGLSFACPAVVDAEGPTLDEQRSEIDATFASAVDGSRYLLQIGASVPLAVGLVLPWPDAERLLAEVSAVVAAESSLLAKLCRAGAVCALAQVALEEGRTFDEAMARARDGGAALVAEALAEPPSVDRLSRALFRTLLKSTEPDRGGALGRIGGALASLAGATEVRLRGAAPVRWRDVERVAPGLGSEGEALFARWLTMALGGLTFFGDAAFGLPIASGLDLLVLSAAVAVFLARAYAAGGGRSRVSLDDAKRALRQIDAGLQHRSSMPSSFGRALLATASLDLLREQLG